MDFSWSEEQQTMKEAAYRFAAANLVYDVIEMDRRCLFPRQAWDKCAAFGIHGLPFPRKYGGSENDILTSVLIMEALGEVCRDNGLLFAINAQMWSVTMPISRFGRMEQQQRYLPGLIDGSLIGGHGMTEPGSGSDAFGLATQARREGDFYILNGRKTFVTNAREAQIFLVFATVDKSRDFLGVTAFLVPRDTPGFTVGGEIEKMGLRTASLGELIMEDCKVPAENILGREGQGALIFGDSMEWERACILACNLGAMERQLARCLQYARQRKQFGKRIGQFQAVADSLVEMKVRLDTGRLLLYRTAWQKKVHNRAPLEAALAKLYLSEARVASCREAIQIHGGYGYATEYELERDLRDALAGTIYSGTSAIQRNLIARYLGLG